MKNRSANLINWCKAIPCDSVMGVGRYPLTPFRGSRSWFWVVALAFAIRIPQMVSPHWFADGDEAIVGLMATHVLQGKGFPSFFFGQTYGFSLFESGVAALLLRLGAAPTWALKLAAFFWFSVGLIGWQKWGGTLSSDRTRSLTLGVLLAVTPAWGVWALKARGWYVTAFGLLPWILWLLSGSSVRRFFAGILTSIIWVSQPLFLAGWFPWAFWHLQRERVKSGILSWILGLVFSILLIRFIWPFDHAYWTPRIFGIPTLETLRASLVSLTVGLGGNHSFSEVSRINIFIPLMAVISLLLWAGLILDRMRRMEPELISSPRPVAMVSMIASLAYVPLLTSPSPRYFLPVAVFLGLALWLNAPRWVIGSWIVLTLVATLSLGSHVFMAPPLPAGTTEGKAMEHLLAELRKKDVHGVYCMDLYLQWQVMYYSQDEFPTRWVEPADRVPEYPIKVDHALFSGKPVAVVGFVNGEGYLEWKDHRSFREVDKRYFLVADPDPETLRSMGFRLNK